MKSLDTDRIDASYDNGVPLLRIPIAAKAKPRKITVVGRQRATDQQSIDA
jgi:HSP20 family protein